MLQNDSANIALLMRMDCRTGTLRNRGQVFENHQGYPSDDISRSRMQNKRGL